MNTTTYTIESVHGVKQTLVLGLLDRTASGQSVKDTHRQMPPKPDGGVTQVAPPTNR